MLTAALTAAWLVLLALSVRPPTRTCDIRSVARWHDTLDALQRLQTVPPHDHPAAAAAAAQVPGRPAPDVTVLPRPASPAAAPAPVVAEARAA